MALYDKKEFAELCKVNTRYLSVQISRGKVILDKHDKIDTENSVNKFYVEKIYGRMDLVPKKPFTAAKPAKPIAKVLSDEEDQEDDEDVELTMEDLLADPNRKNLDYPELERIYKFLQGKKIEKDIEKNQLEIEKKKGIVVPSELIKPVFLQHNQFIVTEFKNAADEVIRIISKKKSLSVNEQAEIRGELVKTINESINKATLASIKNVTNLITDFSDKRGVGERA